MAEEQAASEAQEPPRKGTFRLIMLITVVVLASAAGAATAVLLSGPGESEQPIESDQDLMNEYLNDRDDATYDYYDFPAITTNLDEVRLGRHIQVTLRLAIPKHNEKIVKQARADIEARQEELHSWLTVYFAGCTLDNLRGSGNLNRILREIRQEFNDRLWRDKKPLIHHVLFKDYKVQ